MSADVGGCRMGVRARDQSICPVSGLGVVGLVPRNDSEVQLAVAAVRSSITHNQRTHQTEVNRDPKNPGRQEPFCCSSRQRCSVAPAILWHWITRQTDYYENPLRRQLWRAGHAHAGVLLILSLLALLFVDQTALSDQWKSVVRWTVPSSAILVPAAFSFGGETGRGTSQPTRQPGLRGGNLRERRNSRAWYRTPQRLKVIARDVPISLTSRNARYPLRIVVMRACLRSRDALARSTVGRTISPSTI